MFSLLLFSCSGRIERNLAHLESCLPEKPDSVLSVLWDYPQKALKAKRLQAEYALLLSWVMDKCYIDTEKDSLIRIATNYYADKPLSRHRMLAFYYLSRVQYNAQSYAPALISVQSAIQDALALEDHHYTGLAYRLKGDILEASFNPAGAKEAYEKALLAFDDKADSLYRQYALLYVSRAAFSLHETEECLKGLKELLTETSDSALRSACYQSCVYALMDEANPRPDSALAFFRKWQINAISPPSIHLYTSVALAYEMRSQPDSVAFYMHMAEEAIDRETDLGNLSYAQYRIQTHRHQWEKAVDYLRQTQDIQNEAIYQKLQQSAESAAGEYLMKETVLQRNRLLEQRSHLLSLTILLGLFILTFGASLYWTLQKRRKHREALSIAKEEIADLIRKNRIISECYHEFVREDHRVIDTIIQTYHQESNIRNRMNSVYQWVEDYIQSLRIDKKTFKAIENRVNADGTMDRLDASLPDIPAIDRKFLCLLFSGFSYGAIQAITEIGTQTLYNRKRKYKNILESLGTEDSKALLDRF